jgi:hypothetical protein
MVSFIADLARIRFFVGTAAVLVVFFLDALLVAQETSQAEREASPAAAVPEPALSTTTLLDGKVVPAADLQIAAGALSGREIPAGLTIDELREITLQPAPIKPPEQKPAVVVELIGGGMVPASQVTLADDVCSIAWTHGQPLKVAIDAIRAIRFQPVVVNDEFTKALAAPSADVDRIFVTVEGKTDSVTGLVNKLTDTEISLEIDGQIRTLPRERVFGVVVALAAPETRLPRCTVHFTDGSVLGGDLIALDAKQGQLQLSGATKVDLPRDSIHHVVVRSSRVLYLSDLKPTSVKQQAIVTLPRPWQRDRSVTGKTLAIGPRTFAKGIGVQAHNELSFDVPEGFDVLAATIGLDADAEGKGDCLFEVIVDGQRLLSERMRGSDPPRDIQIPLPRAKQVTLVVLPGAELDLADHADWAEVRLLRNKK